MQYYDELPSTMKYMKEIGYQKDFFTVVVKKQHCGYGRQGRVYESQEGGLYLTMQVKPDVELSKFTTFGLVVGLTILQSIKSIDNSIDIKLKYPNDIILNDKKLGGILIEYDSKKYYNIGIGLNINNKLDNNIKDIATSLLKEGYKINSDELLKMLLKQLVENYNKFLKVGFKGFINEYKQNTNIGNNIITTYKGKKIEGKIIDIKVSGELLMLYRNEKITITL